jgi:hypothetical protein
VVYSFRPNACAEMEYWPMASISAGVVTEAQVEGLPTPPTSTQLALSQPATWTYIWVTVAFLYILGVYLGTIRITRRG